MAIGWITSRDKKTRRYFTSAGVMMKGLRTIRGKTYYFDPSTGVAARGWVSDSGGKRYFNPDTAVMVTGTKTIDGERYKFGSDGYLIVSNSSEGTTADLDAAIRPNQPGSEKTVKNFLLAAMQPVGRTLYVWGGGHNSDATRKGVSPVWASWYNSHNRSYDYDDYRFYSDKGLDCSGYVGWATYQVMNSYATVVSGEIGSYYKGKGWGTVYNQNYLSKTDWKLYPGDIGFDDGHTWIILGQCADKSAVVLHSTPQAGVQISGTTTPSGSYDSQAVALAKQYMSKFKGYTKYNYSPSCGNYIRRGNYLRWTALNNNYKNMTADQILADLFR